MLCKQYVCMCVVCVCVRVCMHVLKANRRFKVHFVFYSKQFQYVIYVLIYQFQVVHIVMYVASSPLRPLVTGRDSVGI